MSESIRRFDYLPKWSLSKEEIMWMLHIGDNVFETVYRPQLMKLHGVHRHGKGYRYSIFDVQQVFSNPNNWIKGTLPKKRKNNFKTDKDND